MRILEYLQKNRLPLLATLVGGGAALAGVGRNTAPVVSAEVASAPELPTSQPSADGVHSHAASSPTLPASDDAPPDGQTVSGDVLQQLDVAKYSYLELGGKEASRTWAAVPLSPSLVGQRVTVTNAELMTHFESATLKRTFETIYFGVLGSRTPDAAVTAAPVHAPSAAPIQAGARGEMSPHPGPGAGADQVAVGNVTRAEGPLGHSVAELNALPRAAAGGRARVHAVVVKSTSGVMGRTFLHVRDGSGEARDGSNDLTVTTAGEVAVGRAVLLEGTLEMDTDFGSGYRYAVLLADASLVGE